MEKHDVPNFGRNFLIWLVIGIVVITTFNMMQGGSGGQGYQKIPYSTFLDRVESGEVASVTIQGNTIRGDYSSSAADNAPASGNRMSFTTIKPDDPKLVDLLRKHNVQINAAPRESGMASFMGLFLSWLPVLIFIGIYIYFMRNMQGNSNRALGFGKSRARLLTEKHGRVTFEDVAGIDEAKDELHEIVDFLRDPQKFQRLGGKIPKGCLLVGPPGTGKTLLARAIAGEANVPFFTISGSDFVEMFVGVGASRVRDMFEQGKKNAPCIIFIDEIDAVGRHRGIGMGGGNDEREQTLNQLLVEMDGFESNEGVILIAATNRPDVLDPALLRPGRFDRQIVVPNPDINGRERILGVHLKKVPLAPDVEARVIARGTPGFSGADLANLVNEAALLAARRGKKVVTMLELEAAKDKVMMGVERKSMVMSEEEKKLTAYHEGGHAIVALHCPASDPIHKATIIPRGRALGMVMRLPEADKLSVTREKLHTDIAVAMGGRVAEEIIFGHEKVTSGASSDIQYATRMARAMVAEWGMSDLMGPIYYGSGQGESYLGNSYGQTGSGLSGKTAAVLEEEVKKIVEGGLNEAKRILTENIDQLHSLAKALLEYETLSGDEIKAILRGEKLDRDGDRPVRKSRGSAMPTSRSGDGKGGKPVDATPAEGLDA
jgi:cell division protease FtsH